MRRLFGKKSGRAEDYTAVLDLEAGQTELAPGMCNLYCPQAAVKTHVRDLLDVLSEQNKISSEQAQQIRSEQPKGSAEPDKQLQKLGLTPQDILQAHASLYGFQFRHIKAQDVDRQAFDKLELSYIRTNLVLPIEIRDGVLIVGTNDPADVFRIDDVKRRTNMHAEVVVCDSEDILAV